MVALLPGFRLQEGNAEVRGYSGSGGNVLIDGTRPASKEETLETILKRIPARLVDHIELVRNSAAGYDMQGYALLANVVRKQEARLSGRLEGEYAVFRHGYSSPRVAGTLSRSEEHTSELQSLMRISYAVFCLKKKKQQENKVELQNNIRKKIVEIQKIYK